MLAEIWTKGEPRTSGIFIGLVSASAAGLDDHERLFCTELIAEKIELPVVYKQFGHLLIVWQAKHIAPHFDDMGITLYKASFEIRIMRHDAVLPALNILLIEVAHIVEVIGFHIRITEKYLWISSDNNQFIVRVLRFDGFAYCCCSDTFAHATINLEDIIHNKICSRPLKGSTFDL